MRRGGVEFALGDLPYLGNRPLQVSSRKLPLNALLNATKMSTARSSTIFVLENLSRLDPVCMTLWGCRETLLSKVGVCRFTLSLLASPANGQ